MKYIVDYNGATRGKVSNKRIAFERNKPVDVKKGDLDHLGKHVQEAEPKKEKTSKSSGSKKK